MVGISPIGFGSVTLHESQRVPHLHTIFVVIWSASVTHLGHMVNFACVCRYQFSWDRASGRFGMTDRRRNDMFETKELVCELHCVENGNGYKV